jgi:hypothetical protein
MQFSHTQARRMQLYLALDTRDATSAASKDRPVQVIHALSSFWIALTLSRPASTSVLHTMTWTWCSVNCVGMTHGVGEDNNGI